MRCKIYASDEGFGHLVRQHAIVEAIRKRVPELEVTLQSEKHLEEAKWIFSDVNFVKKYNNISWAKKSNGSPDVDQIKKFFGDYISRSDEFIRTETGISDYDFVLSDFVYEAFPIASEQNIPSFGVAHFCWDWFFSKLYPAPLSSELLERFRTYAMRADVLYFPPFTPRDILEAYRTKIKEVPFIVRKRMSDITVGNNDKFKILIMDSGSNVLSKPIKKAVTQINQMTDCEFYISEYYRTEADNVSYIADKKLFMDYIPDMDLVISRGGFNTLSECIAYRTPLLVLGESLNPEMDSNMLYLKQQRLGSFISVEEFENGFKQTVSHFIDYEYEGILKSMRNHEYSANGAEVIADDILNRLSL